MYKITDVERSEYQGYIQANKFLAILPFEVLVELKIRSRDDQRQQLRLHI